MAPEVLAGKSVSTSTDVYGLGLIFWEMKSAEKPYDGKTMTEVRHLIIFHSRFLMLYNYPYMHIVKPVYNDR